MSSRPKILRKRSVSLREATLDDLIYHATDRAHHAIGDACQLIDDRHQQHVLCLNVICNLISASSRMLVGEQSRTEKLAFTLESIQLMLDQLTEPMLERIEEP